MCAVAPLVVLPLLQVAPDGAPADGGDGAEDAPAMRGGARDCGGGASSGRSAQVREAEVVEGARSAARAQSTEGADLGRQE